jgi:hemerythrin-like metal-binding domain
MFDFLFDWVPKFNTNIETIDTHHRQFFHIGRECEQLIQIKCMGVSDKQLLDIVGELREYVSYHFYEEERMMLEYAYPGAKEHKKYHQFFAQKVSGINLPALKKNTLEEVKNIHSLLQDKALQHILIEDKKLAEYVIEAQKKTKGEAQVLKDQTDEYENKYGIKICDLDLSKAYLAWDQRNRGRSILIYKEKVRDMSRLTALERNIFFADVARLAKAIQKVYSPDAFNYGEYGDVEERLHIHVVPKYMFSEDFGLPFALGEKKNLLSVEEYKEMAARIRKAIGN